MVGVVEVAEMVNQVYVIIQASAWIFDTKVASKRVGVL